ncbi:hypothetical protein S40288_09617 [Stachybotrys chartarum IBT 40288]|nr:hypothetical protein S40288_09617 [Stachybotrys chartarum IBT 40288]
MLANISQREIRRGALCSPVDFADTLIPRTAYRDRSALFFADMAPPWVEKVKGKLGRRERGTSRGSVPAPSSRLTSPAGPLSVAQQTARSTSPPARSAGTSADIVALSSLQERLWNDAYDEAKSSHPKLVEAYEQILSNMLDETNPTSETREVNVIGGDRETRSRQMQQVVRRGLDRTQKQASVKQGIGEGLQVWQVVRGIVDKAVSMAPEGAIAWAGILSNPITEANENREGIAYVLSRMDWYWNLVSLLLDGNTSAPSTAGLRNQLRQNIEHLYEKLLLYQMKSYHLYHRKWVASITRDLLKIDDWAGQLSDIKDAESAVQQDMEQYNTEEVKTRLHELSDAANKTQKNLQGQAKQREKWRKDDKYEQIMKDLYDTDPRDNKTRIQDAKGGLLRDCYRWVLDHEEFQKWRSDPQSQLLWIKGDPGKGKTMLLCGIIDELKEEPDICLSYFFCEATHTRLSNATAVLRGLIWLLVIQKPSLISHIREKYDYAGKKAFEDGNAWEALSKIFASITNDPSLDGTILAIDALDECKTNRGRLLSFLMKPSRVKWVVTGRNWQDIETSLVSTEEKVWLQLELNQDSISKAVQTYIDYKVDGLARLKTYDKSTKDILRAYLSDNADGTFLWVALVCQELASDQIARKRHTLSKLKEFPSGLDPLYMRMMEHISGSMDATLCKQILAIASVVYRPITLEELKVFVNSMDQDECDDLPQIIKACGSFLTLREGVLSFVHQSAKDFLLEKASDQILPSGVTHEHQALFSKSLKALAKTLERDICKLGVPGFPVDQVSPHHLKALASVHYACVFWVDHLQKSDSMAIKDALQDNGDVHTFMRDKFLYWLECLSLLRSMPQGIHAVHKVEALARGPGREDITELLQDARRFIVSHKTPIEIAPLQAYASTLLFSPEASHVRELFKHEEPDWMVLKPKMEPRWDVCLQTLEGHSEPVTSVVFSADGQHLASGSWDKTVKIWDRASGDCLKTVEGHSNMTFSVVFSADGQYLASGSGDETVKIWDRALGDCLETLEGHSGSVTSVVFSADGQYLASGSDDEMVKIWDRALGDCLKTLEGHSGSVTSVVFSADGQHLASGSWDKTVKIWDCASGDCLKTLEGHSSEVWSVVFSADGQHLASGSGGHLALDSDDRTVKIWDRASGDCLQTVHVGRPLHQLSFDPTDSNCLSTDIGVLNLEIPGPAAHVNVQLVGKTTIPQPPNCVGVGLSTDGLWVMKDGERMLWLPPGYRSMVSAVFGEGIAIGCRSGRVLMMKLSSYHNLDG